jgi:flagellar hook protein FlgE
MSSAVAGLKAHQTALDVIGNNISNVDTPSFKSGSVSFRDTMYQTTQAASKGDGASRAGSNPVQIGYGAAASSVTDDVGKGGEDETGRTGDVYIDGEGFLIVADGTDKKYTRVGRLDFDSDGNLTDGNGGYVLDKGGNKIKYDTSKGDLSNTSIAPDGTITATQGGSVVTVGQIGLANFKNAAGLQKIGNSYYKETNNSGAATFATPGGDGTGTLVSGALEASNTDLAAEFSNMVMYERAYQANTKMISVADEMYQTLVNMK